jgi:hypothetical protein
VLAGGDSPRLSSSERPSLPLVFSGAACWQFLDKKSRKGRSADGERMEVRRVSGRTVRLATSSHFRLASLATLPRIADGPTSATLT